MLLHCGIHALDTARGYRKDFGLLLQRDRLSTASSTTNTVAKPCPLTGHQIHDFDQRKLVQGASEDLSARKSKPFYVISNSLGLALYFMNLFSNPSTAAVPKLDSAISSSPPSCPHTHTYVRQGRRRTSQAKPEYYRAEPFQPLHPSEHRHPRQSRQVSDCCGYGAIAR